MMKKSLNRLKRKLVTILSVAMVLSSCPVTVSVAEDVQANSGKELLIIDDYLSSLQKIDNYNNYKLEGESVAFNGFTLHDTADGDEKMSIKLWGVNDQYIRVSPSSYVNNSRNSYIRFNEKEAGTKTYIEFEATEPSDVVVIVDGTYAYDKNNVYLSDGEKVQSEAAVSVCDGEKDLVVVFGAEKGKKYKLYADKDVKLSYVNVLPKSNNTSWFFSSEDYDRLLVNGGHDVSGTTGYVNGLFFDCRKSNSLNKVDDSIKFEPYTVIYVPYSEGKTLAVNTSGGYDNIKVNDKGLSKNNSYIYDPGECEEKPGYVKVVINNSDAYFNSIMWCGSVWDFTSDEFFSELDNDAGEVTPVTGTTAYIDGLYVDATADGAYVRKNSNVAQREKDGIDFGKGAVIYVPAYENKAMCINSVEGYVNIEVNGKPLTANVEYVESTDEGSDKPGYIKVEAKDDTNLKMIEFVEPVKVSFNVGDENVYSAITGKGGLLNSEHGLNAIDKLTVPEGKVFAYWATTENGEKAFSYSTPIEADTTLYAVFEESKNPGELFFDDIDTMKHGNYCFLSADSNYSISNGFIIYDSYHPTPEYWKAIDNYNTVSNNKIKVREEGSISTGVASASKDKATSSVQFNEDTPGERTYIKFKTTEDSDVAVVAAGKNNSKNVYLKEVDEDSKKEYIHQESLHGLDTVLFNIPANRTCYLYADNGGMPFNGTRISYVKVMPKSQTDFWDFTSDDFFGVLDNGAGEVTAVTGTRAYIDGLYVDATKDGATVKKYNDLEDREAKGINLSEGAVIYVPYREGRQLLINAPNDYDNIAVNGTPLTSSESVLSVTDEGSGRTGYIKVEAKDGEADIKNIYFNNDISVPVAVSDLTYDGTEKVGVLPGVGYKLSGTYEATNVGEYTATAKLEDGCKWDDGTTSDKEIEWSIGKALLTVTANPKTIAYGDEPANDGVSYSGFVKDENESVLDGTLKYTYDYEQNDTVGEYKITPSGLTSDNYNIEYVPGTLNVNKADSITGTPDTTISVEFACDNVSKVTLPDNWSWSDADKDKALEVGIALTVTAVYNGEDKANYADEAKSVSVSITRSACTHNYDTAEYIWSDDNKTCTATKTCSICNDKVTETVNTTSTTISNCESEGKTTYTATFTKDGFEKQTKDVIIDATGHKYGEPTYTWSEDGKTCTATAVCANDAKHVLTEKATVTSKVTTPSTCKDMGKTTYTAAFTNEVFTTQTKEVTDVAKQTTHTPSEVVKENEVAETCDKDGSYDEVVYCSVCGEEISRETKKIDAKGHDYGTPEYKWSDDGKTCTATVICKREGCTESIEGHKVTENAVVTSKVKEAATTEKMGTTTYTATFKNTLFTTQTKDVEDIPKLDKPSDNPSDNPSDKPADKPSDDPVDNPSDNPSDKPADKPSDNPVDNPSDKPSDKPQDTTTPVETTIAPAVKEEGTTLSVAETKAEVVVTSKAGEEPTVEYKGTTDTTAKEVTVPDSVTLDGVTYKVTEVAKEAFKGNKTIESIELSENIETIGENAFDGCTSLKTVDLPDRVKEIGDSAFNGCTSLKKVTIPNSVTVIGDKAFNGCKKLAAVNVGKNVVKVGDRAFAGCTSVKKVILSAKTSKIGKQAFKGTKKLKTLNIKSKKLTVKSISPNAFKGIGNNVTIIVPKGMKKAYTALFRKKGLPKNVKIK